MKQLLQALLDLVYPHLLELWLLNDSDRGPFLGLLRASNIDQLEAELPNFANYANSRAADIGLSLFPRLVPESGGPSLEMPTRVVCVELPFASYEGGEAECRERVNKVAVPPAGVLYGCDRLYLIWLLTEPAPPNAVLRLARLLGRALGGKSPGCSRRSIVLRRSSRTFSAQGAVLRLETWRPGLCVGFSEFLPYVQLRSRGRGEGLSATSELGLAAKRFHEHGLSIVPVQPREKRPWDNDWPHLSLTADDVDLIWAATPNANIGLICGSTGFVALDCDGPACRDWAASNMPATPFRTISGSGTGAHFVYRWHVGIPLRPRKVVPPGLTIRTGEHEGVSLLAEGNQFVLPGSVHPSGGRYQWADGDPLPELSSVPVFDLTWLPQQESPPSRTATRTVRRAGDAGRGDYSTLDIVRLFETHGLYLRPLLGGRHAVVCPWSGEHSTKSANARDTSAAVWEATDGKWPSFRCLHAHCDNRRIRDVIDFFGHEIVDTHCGSRWDAAARKQKGTD
ncbi:MAG: bifunctional DNA primase/polymerase [Deltaproteobacteria bacterium]|nr:bifunctional DNA primase/polymerase [Deltaproteobacteria bacterium]